ncbi:hypothetical protein K438DRAFT_1852626 [Mycena galopus ATCC 62051]|nr:hypothetical protein K438DRAFT_1852626 [Mycena galopus ATCC 62051]
MSATALHFYISVPQVRDTASSILHTGSSDAHYTNTNNRVWTRPEARGAPVGGGGGISSRRTIAYLV